MPLLRALLLKAARRLASDPRVQQMAADAYDKAKPKVQQMAADAYDKAKPKVEQTAREIREAAREASPLDDPGEFARRVKNRLSRKDPPTGG